MAIPGQYDTSSFELPDDDDLEPIALEYDDGDIGNMVDEPEATQFEASYLAAAEVPV